MRKAEIIQIVSRRTGIIQADVEKILDKTFLTIREQVASGQEVRLQTFGVFLSKVQAPKVARRMRGTTKNPEPILLPERVKAVFKPSKQFLLIDNGFDIFSK